MLKKEFRALSLELAHRDYLQVSCCLILAMFNMRFPIMLLFKMVMCATITNLLCIVFQLDTTDIWTMSSCPLWNAIVLE